MSVEEYINTNSEIVEIKGNICPEQSAKVYIMRYGEILNPVVFVRYHDLAGKNTRLPKSLNKVQGILPPLGLSSLAAFLEIRGIEVKIIDCQALGISKEQFRERIFKLKPKIVCIGPMMTSAIEGVLEAAQICKREGCITIIGGPHLSAQPLESLKYDFIDYGIQGEAEYSLLELVEAVNNNSDVSKIRGLIWRDNGVLRVNPSMIIDNLDELPMPAYHLLPMHTYNSIIAPSPVATMMVGRGCPYNCGFCYKTPSDRKIRYKSVNLIVQEMEHLVNVYKVKEIMFYDDTLTLDRKYILELLKEIEKSSVIFQWEAPTRVNHVDEELIEKMSNAGCIRLRLGVESGNDEIRKMMRKGVSREQIIKAFKLCRKYNIETFAYFIIGYIGETEKTIKETIDFAIELDPDFAMFTTATPMPHTDLFMRAVEAGIMKQDYWVRYSLSEDMERIPFLVKNADQWTKKAYHRFYFRPKYVLRKILKIHDIDAMRKYVRAFKGLTGL